jgi:hypothetical protein
VTHAQIAGGPGIDMVGCHPGVISGNTFRHSDVVGGNGVQAKGETTSIQFSSTGSNTPVAPATQIGGSTGLNFSGPTAARVRGQGRDRGVRNPLATQVKTEQLL